ncbi:acyltransferase family protein [Actibacterium pelagium]|uniref:Acyltransferase n=1 Tax=Actibacterium pelagium TaxID=2029103 RepID=A0A917ALD9_9RHOB|nr:acyltransferase family protein [Actibacterium pelagium]GGE56946.1 acyltransferase [Actibacterium pelagium]
MRPLCRNSDRDPRLDGLRALAVLSVLAFHLGLPWQGGYLGVDIFFVLSGYLIFHSLLHPKQAGTQLLRTFFLRRVMRLAPALITALFGVVLIAPFVLLPPELSFLGQSLLATALLVPNFFFWSSFDYFSTAAHDSPLLHLWSLGVEAQFYLIAPFLLLVRRWISKTWWYVFLGGAVALSFALALFAHAFHPKAGFYWMPTRFWQFGFGAFIAIGTVRAGHWASGAGIAVLVGGLVAAPSVPFWAGIGVTIGTGLLISAPRTGPVARLLGGALPTWIGARSYTLYLIHWPVIVFARLLWGPDTSWTEKLLLAAISMGLAAGVTRWVEQPAMRAGCVRPVTIGAVVGLIIAVALMPQSLWRGMYPQTVVELSAYADYKERHSFYGQTLLHRCFITDQTREGAAAFDSLTCLPPRDGRPQILLIGDSHAAHLSAALRKQADWQLGQVTMAGCRPLIAENPEGDCAALMTKTLRLQRPDLWVISARWQAEELSELSATIDRLSGRVLVLGPVPEYPGGLPQQLARDAWTGRETAPWRADPKLPQLDARVRQALAGTSATYVSLIELLCPNGPCKTRVGTVPLQFDYGHFTAEGAEYVVSRISALLTPQSTSKTMVWHVAK